MPITSLHGIFGRSVRTVCRCGQRLFVRRIRSGQVLVGCSRRSSLGEACASGRSRLRSSRDQGRRQRNGKHVYLVPDPHRSGNRLHRDQDSRRHSRLLAQLHRSRRNGSCRWTCIRPPHERHVGTVSGSTVLKAGSHRTVPNGAERKPQRFDEAPGVKVHGLPIDGNDLNSGKYAVVVGRP